MPDIFLIASREDTVVLKHHIKTIGSILREATAEAITDLENDSAKVAVYIIAHEGGDNIPALQILGMASWSGQREAELSRWKEALAQAWWKILKKISRLSIEFPTDQVEVWPILPKGSWGLAKTILNQGEWR